MLYALFLFILLCLYSMGIEISIRRLCLVGQSKDENNNQSSSLATKTRTVV